MNMIHDRWFSQYRSKLLSDEYDRMVNGESYVFFLFGHCHYTIICEFTLVDVSYMIDSSIIQQLIHPMIANKLCITTVSISSLY